jgi:hypothetical protein
MAQYIVKLEGGGEMRVNASSQEAANNNVQGTGNQVQGSSSGNTSGSTMQTTAGNEPTAADGQKLSHQSPETQGAYASAYGPNAAAQWTADHNAAIGASSRPSGGGSGGAQTYNTPNGPKTYDQIVGELKQANWDGKGDPVSVYNQTASAGKGGTPGTGTTGGQPAVPGATAGGDAAKLEKYIQDINKAVAAGNDRAFFEAVREFDLTHGLDRDKFSEDMREFNESLELKKADYTGLYGGNPTQQARKQEADVQLSAIKQAADLQANPFRQQEAIGQLGRLLGGYGVAGFSSPNTVQGVGTQGGAGTGMSYLQQMIDDIKDPAPNTARMNSVLDAIPTPTKLNSVEFMRAAPSTQNLVLQGMQTKYGLDPEDAKTQIKNTLPGFQSPTTLGGVRR